jgi:divalent metal cation (Fe/Co/Zn/Cd) transporter
LWLSLFSIAWSAGVGSFAVYSALAGGSLSLLGFGADAVIDAAASIALVWRFVVESRDPERAGRVERRAERVVGLALVALALYLALASIGSIAAGAYPDASSSAVALLLVSIVVLPPLAIAKRRVAASLFSGALRADSILTGIAALLAAISLVSLAAVQTFGLWWADAAAALVVTVVVLREGWSSLRSSHSVG